MFVYAPFALKQHKKIKKNYGVINTCFKQSVESVFVPFYVPPVHATNDLMYI